ILQTLRELGLDRNTFVLFTNDNGGGGKTSRGPLRGAKFGPKYEGHMRVSTIAWWPGKIPDGSTSSEIMTTTDIMPTIARMAGQPVPTDRIIDGKDISHLLFDKGGATSPHQTLYYENDGIRQGKWKLVRYRVKKDRINELYDLEADPGERNNLADKHSDRVKAMKAALDAHVAQLQKNTRPAGFVENPKPILAEAGNLPTLREYRGLSGKQPTPAKPKQNREANEAKPAKQPAKPGAAGKRPDILFIAIDDMNDWTTLFDDKNPIQTPNLKRLAERGAFFSRAYCAVPACNPSRTAILTGLAPTTSGVYSNGQSWKQLLPDVVTLPQYFGQHGYATRGGGKIFHHGGTGTDRKDNPSFDEFFKLRIHANKPKTNYNGYVRGDRNIGGLASPSWDWGVHEVAKQTDEFTVDYITNVMKNEKRDKPLFLAAGIFRPHLPFWAPHSTFERYPFDKVKLPPRPQGDLDDVPPTGVRMSRTESFIFDNTIKPPVDRPGSLTKMVQCYQAAADYADEMVGRLLDQLDATGRADNTIIILWSDHGYHLGDKNATVKFTLWEKANHVPFIIVAPGVTTPGTVINRPVSLLDIYPTLIDLAGLPKRDGLDGVSLVPLLNSSKVEWNRPAVMTQGRGNHAIRSDRWRYIRYADGTEELYDHNSDPWEWKNLAGDPKHTAVIAEHRKWLPKSEAEIVRRTAKPKTGKPARPARNRPTRIDFTPAEYKPAENDILIADFEGKGYGKWQIIGEAFGKHPSQAETLRNRAIGYLGKGFINTYLKGDKTTGELISPKFRIERKHINFLIGGGKHLGRTGVQLRVDDKTARAATGHSLKDTKGREIMDWHSFKVAEFIGKDAIIKILDKTPGGWGHTVVDHIFQSDSPMAARLPDALKKADLSTPRSPAAKPTDNRPVIKPSPPKSARFVPPSKPGVTLKDEWSTFPLYDQVGYDQSLRPQFHFTSRMGWLNDPNGMVYYDGEWHMMFQHYAKGNASGAKSWGNAVSADLMHWKQLPHAISPYPNVKWKDGNIHAIWSGSAVVDENNALGKQKGEVKTLYSIYTATHAGEDRRAAFFQGAA
ncbi:MAG: sulfatase-like hydrolase/transferase, partial [Planctomycetota bacterium]|nr:sulfatase-like hydrolase/transferase [Planctomycetota bacterium]